jgi:hypothetical protein
MMHEKTQCQNMSKMSFELKDEWTYFQCFMNILIKSETLHVIVYSRISIVLERF